MYISDDGDEDFDPKFEDLKCHFEVLYKGREKIERLGASPSGALFYLWNVLSFARDLMGEKAFDTAMGRSSNGEELLLLAHRLQAISPFFKGSWPDTFSYDEFIEEIYAISGGDAPRILKHNNKKQGKSGNAFRLATHKLKALVWLKALRRRGLSAGEADNVVSSAFGFVTKSAMDKWEAECRGKLGDKEVDRAFAAGVAVDHATWDRKMTDDEALAALKEAGARYLAEKALTKAESPLNSRKR